MLTKFNTYIPNIDYVAMKELCLSRGKTIQFRKGDFFVKAGEVSHYIGYVESGIFRYSVFNATEGKSYNIGFTFKDEFIADYPGCIYGMPSKTDIQALKASIVHICKAEDLAELYEETANKYKLARINAEQLFLQTWSRYVDMYSLPPEERYKKLLNKCPDILQEIPLKEIASYLKITPTHMSRIRKKLLNDK